MRNLKKIISLVLAMVMVLSLMVTASATSFVDDEEITYKEAVEVMAGLGVLNGVKNADGTYNFLPKEKLNRAAGAKIVAYIANGGALDKDLMATLDNPFTDVAGWAVDSVKYCYSQGIINGIGGGLFDPSNALDGYAFGKMMLEAAGYDWQSAVGSNWKTKVLSTLKANKLLTGLETLVFSQPMTREQACQMAWNIMNSSPEGYVYTLTTGGITYTFATANEAAIFKAQISAAEEIVPVASSSLYSEKFNGKTAIGAVTDNGSIVYGQEFSTIGGVKYAVETGLDDLGHVVKVYYKDAAAEPTKGYEVYSVTDLSTELVVSAAQAVTADTGSTAKVTKLFGSVTAVDSTYHNTVSNAGVVSGSISAVVFGGTNPDTGAAAAGTYVIYNGKVVGYRAGLAYDVVKVTVTVTDADKGEYKVGTALNDATYVLNGPTASANYDKVVSAEKVDWLSKVTTGSSASDIYLVATSGEVYSFLEVPTVTGKVTKTDTNKLYIDGVEYASNGSGEDSTLTNKTTDLTIGSGLTFADEYKFYLDENGAIFAAVPTAEATDPTAAGIIYATKVYTKTTYVDSGYGDPTPVVSYYVQGVDAAGVEVVFQMTETEASGNFKTTTLGDKGLKTIYTVTTSYDNGVKATVADLTALTDDTTIGGQAAATNSGAVAATAVKIAANDYYASDVKFIYVANSGSDLSVVVKNGVQALDSDDCYAYYGVKAAADTNYDVKYVFVDGAPGTAVAGNDLVWVTGATSSVTVPYTQANGTPGTAFVHTVYINGVETEVKTAASQIDGGNAGFYTYSVDSVTGLYSFEDYASGVGVNEDAKLTAMYKNLITTKDGAGYTNADLTDANAADVVIVDLVNTGAGATPVTTLAGILAAGNYKLAYVGTQAAGVSLIYIIGTTA